MRRTETRIIYSTNNFIMKVSNPILGIIFAENESILIIFKASYSFTRLGRHFKPGNLLKNL